MIPEEQLLFYNQQGLIPGPDETEQEFVRRADYCLALKSKLPDLFKEAEPGDLQLGEACIQQAFSLTKGLYDLLPEWIPLLFSNYKLAPWHGGCAWIFQLSKDVPCAAFFQLRKAFRTNSVYLHLYERNELIAHELVHAARMMFQEPRFEEIIAYQSAATRFRKTFGPVIQSARESLIFVLSLGLVVFLEAYSLFTHDAAAAKIAAGSALLPLGLLGYGLFRLWRRQTQFSRCLRNVKHIIAQGSPAALALRLTDQEICAFANMHPNDISAYIKENAINNIRLKMILLAYTP